MNQVFRNGKKMILWLCIIIIVSMTAFHFGKKANAEQTQAQRLSFFVNQIYFELQLCQWQLQVADEWKYESLDNSISGPYNMLLQSMNRIGLRFEDASYYINNGIYNYIFSSHNLFGDSEILTTGIQTNNQLVCDGFWDDKRISKDEKAFLGELSQDIAKAMKKIKRYSNGANTEELTVAKINTVFRPLFDKYDIFNLVNTSLIKCKE